MIQYSFQTVTAVALVIIVLLQYIQICNGGTCTIGLYGSYDQLDPIEEVGPFVLNPNSTIKCSGDDLKGSTTILISNQLKSLQKAVSPTSLFKFTDSVCGAPPCPLIQFNSDSKFGLNFKNSSIWQISITPDANPPKSLLQANTIVNFKISKGYFNSFALNKNTFQSTATYYNYKDGLGIRYPNKEQGFLTFDTPGNVTFEGCVFANNKAGRAVIIDNPSEVMINKTVFVNNYGGLLINNGSSTDLNNVTFSKNKAPQGAGISINGGTWSITGYNVGFNDNFAENKTFPAGAAVYGLGGTRCAFQYSTFKNNKNLNFSSPKTKGLTSYTDQPGGGALYLNGTSDVASLNSTFYKNQGFIGGAMSLPGVSSFRVDVTNMQENVAELDAATIFSDSTTFYEVADSSYKGNIPNVNGSGSMIITGDPQGAILQDNQGDIAGMKEYTLKSANPAYQGAIQANNKSDPGVSGAPVASFGEGGGSNGGSQNPGNRCAVGDCSGQNLGSASAMTFLDSKLLFGLFLATLVSMMFIL